MDQRKRPPVSVFAALLFLTVVIVVPAQNGSDPFAFVIFAEGNSMSVYRNDELTTYDVLADDVIGIPLLPGDLIQTDGDTFVELQVMPSRTIVKIAENTTVEIEQIDGSGGGMFNISYGRLRARVERISRDERFEIRGFTAVAGIRGTDFGYDMVVARAASAEMQTKVYVFEGEVEVTENVASQGTPDGTGAESDAPVEAQTVLIEADQMVNVVSAAPGSIGAPARKVVFQKREIENEIRQYWADKDFRVEAVDPDRVEEEFPGISARVQQLSEERRRYEDLQRLRREGVLNSQDRLLAEGAASIEEREPERIAFGEPGPSEQIERIVAPNQDLSRSQQRVRSGHWMVGLGFLMGITGVASAWIAEGVRTVQDINPGRPSTGLMLGGAVFLGSGLFSYLFSLGAD